LKAQNSVENKRKKVNSLPLGSSETASKEFWQANPSENAHLDSRHGKKKFRGLSRVRQRTILPSDRRLSAKLLPTFADLDFFL
jgi:hypothetical protein